MNLFWILASAMAVLALVFILPPLLRRTPESDVQADELNAVVTRERLAELQSDLDSGRIEAAGYQAAKEDLERELLADLQQSGGNASRQHGGRWAALLIVLLLPLAAVLLYQGLGNEPVIDLLAQQPAGTAAQASSTTQPSIEDMVARLATRLQEQPDDLRGWTMLAKSYSVMQRFDQAVSAYREIQRLGGGKDADTLADFADALAATNEGRFSEEAGQALASALQQEPGNIKALWLAGHWKMQQDDVSTAISYWEQVGQQLPADSEDHRILVQQIQAARRQAGLPEQPAEPAMASSDAPAPGTAAAASSPAASLQVSVSIDPALRAKAGDDDTVFIFARAANGPRMPLAIVRKQVRDLPVTVTLDDSMSMAPGMVMSAFPQLTIGARVSKSGNAMPQSGDLQGSQSPVTPAATGSVQLIINSVTP